MHLSKPYWDGHTLLVNVVNQTAGVFGGDRIDVEVVVEAGARVLLASPSAARFHPSHGRESSLEQTFRIASGGSLDVFPELAIPQRDSLSFQKTSIELAAGAELIYLETLTPGRVATGEVFAFARHGWATDICLAGRNIHRERAALVPPRQGLAGLTALFPASYYAGLVIVSPEAGNWAAAFPREVAALGDDALRVGASKLPAGGWTIRLLAADSLALRRGIAEIRKLVYRYLGRPLPDLRRS